VKKGDFENVIESKPDVSRIINAIEKLKGNSTLKATNLLFFFQQK